jgi:uncharacterized RDD family membrane protein YckC
MENRVGFWPRFGAHLIDLVALVLLAFLAKGAAASLFPDAVAAALAAGGKAKATSSLALVQIGVASTLLGPLYALIEGFTGWSPGKLLLGLRIVDDQGRRAPLTRLLPRVAVKASGSFLALGGMLAGSQMLSSLASGWSVVLAIGCLLVLRRSRQALHDMAANTAVLRASDVAP